MKGLALLTVSLLATLGCSAPTAPDSADEAQAADRARTALEDASRSGLANKIALN